MINLLVEKRGPVLWIYFNRPESKNAVTLEAAREFLAAIRFGMRSKDVSVLVVSGKGGVFSSGGDIKHMKGAKDLKRFFLDISMLVHTAVKEIRKGDKPVLAAISGYVGGIAFGLVQAADLLIASSDAKFCAATFRLGLVANGGATYYLPRRVGLSRASEILFLAETVSAGEACRMGLVNRVVSPDRLEAETRKIAEQLASSPRKALARLKKILNESLDSTLSAQLERERQAIAWSATTEDFREGIEAFLAKRNPVFNQK